MVSVTVVAFVGYLAAHVTFVVVIFIGAYAHYRRADGAGVSVTLYAYADDLAARVTLVVAVLIGTVADLFATVVTEVVAISVGTQYLRLVGILGSKSRDNPSDNRARGEQHGEYA